jgi:F0F1-type ATP synthase epsilon subunit
MVKKVTLPASEGQMCVLDFHQPFLVRLQKGRIVFDDARLPAGKAGLPNGKAGIPIKEGIAFMRANTLTVFAQT